MIKRAKITEYINGLVGQPRIYGQNDCNLLACKVLDILTGSDLHDKLHSQYDSIPDGLKKCKALTGYTNILQPITKSFQLVTDEPRDGDLLVTEHKLGNRKYYSVSIVFSDYTITADSDRWIPVHVSAADYTHVYRYKEADL